MKRQTIQFQQADRKFLFPNKTELKVFIPKLFKKERQTIESIRYIFCSDEFLLDMNRRFLNHDFYTDIITFDLTEAGSPIEAEIYISVDRVKDNAKKLGGSYKEEMLRVLFHGALHLCGYKDKKKRETELMRQKEEEYISLYRK